VVAELATIAKPTKEQSEIAPGGQPIFWPTNRNPTIGHTIHWPDGPLGTTVGQPNGT